MKEPIRISLVGPKDLDISYFVGPGAGGQNKQKNQTGCQIVHKLSGAIGRCSDTRSQAQNRQEAFRRLACAPKFKVWLAKRLYEIRQGESIEQAVERQMAPENLQVQARQKDRWTEYPNP